MVHGQYVWMENVTLLYSNDSLIKDTKFSNQLIKTNVS